MPGRACYFPQLQRRSNCNITKHVAFAAPQPGDEDFLATFHVRAIGRRRECQRWRRHRRRGRLGSRRHQMLIDPWSAPGLVCVSPPCHKSAAAVCLSRLLLLCVRWCLLKAWAARVARLGAQWKSRCQALSMEVIRLRQEKDDLLHVVATQHEHQQQHPRHRRRH